MTCSHEPYEWLVQAVESVQAQTYPTRPIIVLDGQLATQGDDTKFMNAVRRCELISATVRHHDAGDWARSAGALHAVALGYDAVGFLDGDNWLESDHVEKLMALGVDLATSSRHICHMDGTRLGLDLECDGAKHVDTSCFLLRRRAFGLLAHWALIPPSLSQICDRLFWNYASSAIEEQRLTHEHSSAPTVNFRSRYAVHYNALGIEPPPGSKPDISLPAGSYRLPWPFDQEIVVPETT